MFGIPPPCYLLKNWGRKVQIWHAAMAMYKNLASTGHSWDTSRCRHILMEWTTFCHITTASFLWLLSLIMIIFLVGMSTLAWHTKVMHACWHITSEIEALTQNVQHMITPGRQVSTLCFNYRKQINVGKWHTQSPQHVAAYGISEATLMKPSTDIRCKGWLN